MSHPSHSRTDLLARALSAERDRAEKYLWAEMAKLGLHQKDGWTIAESMRETEGGTQIVLRPLHRQLPSPDGLECVVGIVEDDGGIHGHCNGPDGKPVGRF